MRREKDSRMNRGITRMNDAFISYRRKSGYLMAQLLRYALKEQGIYCYLDLEEDRPGEFDKRLLKAIRDSSNFILILTRDALNRCVHDDDWVRMEIEEAVASGKNIIPVLYPGFKWPEKLNEQLPAAIRQIENKQSVILRQEYLRATVEKIVSYMEGIKRQDHEDDEPETIPEGTKAFFVHGLNHMKGIRYVDMAFHAGEDWRRSTDKIDILTHFLKQKVSVRVLVNSAQTVTGICSHMSQPLKKYTGFDNCVEEWAELAENYPEIVHVRVADVPLLHRLYILRGDAEGLVNVKYYTYGNYIPNRDARSVFDHFQEGYRLYTEEFEYIWNHASREIKDDHIS